MTTMETGMRRLRCLDGEFAKIDEEWSLSETNAAAVGSGSGKDKAPQPLLVFATTVLYTAQ